MSSFYPAVERRLVFFEVGVRTLSGGAFTLNSGAIVQEKVIRMPGMVSILVTFAAVISSLSLLVPVSPAWVASGGAGTVGAGSVTAVLMAFTVITQLFAVQPALERLGWAKTMLAGSLLMGLGSPIQAIAPDLTLALISSAIRGIGFGIITVCGSTALSILFPPHQRGRAVGVYGLAAAFPQMILTPLAPWLADVLGFRVVLCLGIVAAIGAPFAWHLGKIVDDARTTAAATEEVAQTSGLGSVFRIIWPALLTLTLITATGGAVMTFAIDIAPTALLASATLLALTVTAAPTRFWGGSLSDRFGTRVLMVPVLALSTIGVVIIGVSGVLAEGNSRIVLLLLGAILVGAGYGSLQSVTMVRVLNDAGSGNSTQASVAWNANFDIGTGLGGLIIGAMAQMSGFPVAWWVWAALIIFAGVVIAVKDMRETKRTV